MTSPQPINSIIEAGFTLAFIFLGRFFYGLNQMHVYKML